MKPATLLLLAAAAGAQPLVPVDPALAVIPTTKRFLQPAISPDGKHLAYVEALAAPDQSAIYIAPRIRIGASAGSRGGKAACDEHAVAFSPDSRQIAFLSDCEKKEQLQVRSEERR